uniref:Uncharacterized protein n=1 Tax=Arundo donax TaxID=35708 RepID=A0A0A9EFD7_ARUDO
MRLSLIRSRRK